MGYTAGVAFKKLTEKEENWIADSNVVEIESLVEAQRISIDNANTEGFIFENKLGYPMA